MGAYLFLIRTQCAGPSPPVRTDIGLPLDESEDLLNRLWVHASKPEFAWYQKWKAGDLVMWDNRGAMHRRDAFDAASRRLMHRTQIKGDRPFFDPATLAA